MERSGHTPVFVAVVALAALLLVDRGFARIDERLDRIEARLAQIEDRR